MEEWHGKIVVRQPRNGEPLQGRIIYQGILEPKWFKVHWEDGTVSEHMPGMFRYFGCVEEADASPTVMHKPDPAQLFTLVPGHSEMQVNWSVRSPKDILERMQQLLPGEHLEDQVNTIFKSLAKRARHGTFSTPGTTRCR
jgi:hypothetical protein